MCYWCMLTGIIIFHWVSYNLILLNLIKSHRKYDCIAIYLQCIAIDINVLCKSITSNMCPCVLPLQFIPISAAFLINLVLYIIYLMSPALLCKSSVQSGNAEQCALAFIHLLSSSCTRYYYNISYMFVPIVNA